MNCRLCRRGLVTNKLSPAQTGRPSQEAWGWELPATCGRDSDYLCMSGNADHLGNEEGEWRIIVKKRRSLWERLTGKATITADDRF